MSSDPLFILETILTEDGVCLGLCRVLDIGIVEQLLDAHQDLLDRDGGAPVLLIIEEGEAHRAGGVDVGVKQRGLKLALGGRGGVVILEDHAQPVQTTVPGGIFLARDSAFPVHQVEGAIGILCGSSDETKWMIFPPGFTFLC